MEFPDLANSWIGDAVDGVADGPPFDDFDEEDGIVSGDPCGAVIGGPDGETAGDPD